MSYLGYALLSAVAAAATAVLAKLGVTGVPSHLATALRTALVLVFAWSVVLATGEQRALRALSSRALLFLALSAVGTAVSWLAYFKALQLAPVSRVAPIDKLSLPLTVALGALLLGETVSARVALGATLMAAGALLTLGKG